jgi:hypothetical protein
VITALRGELVRIDAIEEIEDR